jgi:hypothetical protein
MKSTITTPSERNLCVCVMVDMLALKTEYLRRFMCR